MSFECLFSTIIWLKLTLISNYLYMFLIFLQGISIRLCIAIYDVPISEINLSLNISKDSCLLLLLSLIYERIEDNLIKKMDLIRIGSVILIYRFRRIKLQANVPTLVSSSTLKKMSMNTIFLILISNYILRRNYICYMLIIKLIGI